MTVTVSSPQIDDAPFRLEGILSASLEGLPILRQSCLRILDLTADDGSSANDIGQAIMHDQSLTAKIIKFANSPAYHTRSVVTTPTQAVTIIGFDVVRSIAVAAELIEQFEEKIGKSSDLKRHLACSLLAATQAQELGMAIHYPEGGTLFTTTMLYSLGNLILALYAPEIYHKLEETRNTDPEALPELEKDLLGKPLHRLASSIAKKWHLPEYLVSLLETPLTLTGERLNTKQKQLEGLVYGANELSRCLLAPSSSLRENNLELLLKNLTKALGIPRQQIEKSTVKSFEKACQFCEAIKIDKTNFLSIPSPNQFSTPSPQTHLFQTLRSVVGSDSRESSHVPNEPATPDDPVAPPLNESGATSVWAFLQEFCLEALGTSDPNKILSKAAEGLHTAGNFDRVVLTLLVPARGVLEARIGYGQNVQALFPIIGCHIKDDHLLTTALHQFEPLQVASLRDEMMAGRISAEFLQQWGEGPCLLGCLYAKNKPIGVLVADHGKVGRPITQSDYANFVMVLGQVNVNLTRLAN